MIPSVAQKTDPNVLYVVLRLSVIDLTFGLAGVGRTPLNDITQLNLVNSLHFRHLTCIPYY